MKLKRDPRAEKPRPGESNKERLSLPQRIELFSLRTPWRVKVAIVWIMIFAILAVLFALVDFDTQWMREHWVFIVRGIQWTLVISVGGIVLAVVLALLGALARISRNPVAFGVSGFYVSFFRGTPLIVQMFILYLGLAQIGQNLGRDYFLTPYLTLNGLQAGILALGLNYGAYMTEIFRAGIQSVAHGQTEAAHALGMNYRQTMRRIVLPQAIRVIIPPTGNEFIAMLKDSALVSFIVSVVSQMEIFRRASLLGRRDFRIFEALVLAAMMYWILTGIFSFFQSRLERRLSKGYVRSAESLPRVGGPHAGGAPR